jgi:hypothetical protein
MTEINVGDSVVCGICGKDTSVQFITDREGGKAFDLGCMHRNAVCPTCGSLAKDASETILAVSPSCRTCDPQDFAYDDDE